jgi:rfaE bifunctional protein kinase chain/domain
LSPAPKRRRTPPAKTADTSVDLTRLLDIVAAIPRQRICVAGDLVLDEFVSTEISRVSREAPVLILRHRRSAFFPGGAANAANNLIDLGARVAMVGVVGDDESGRTLVNYFRGKKGDVSHIQHVKGWVTPRKTRFLAGWTHTTEQQVLRVDHEPDSKLPERTTETLRKKAQAASRSADAVLLSDYGFGAVTPELARSLKGKLTVLDSRFRLLDYAGTSITAATPNEPELEAAYGEKAGTDQAKLEDLGRRATAQLSVQSLLVTRGKDGMAVFESGEKGAAPSATHIPIFGSDKPVDVTGAGDTVIAVFTVALAAGASSLEAAHLANIAAGLVVMKPRTATVTAAELLAVLRREATAAR